jgi:hypothetical protein
VGFDLRVPHEVYGYEELLRDNPEIFPPRVVSLFDVITTVEGVLNDGLSRFFTDSDHQQRIIDAFKEIGESSVARLLTRAFERFQERKREGCENPEDFREDERLSAICSEFIRRHKAIQDAFAKFVRSNFLDPDFLGPKLAAYLLAKSA